MWLSKYDPERVRRLVHLGGSPGVHIPVPTFFKVLTSPIGAVIVRMPMSSKMLRSQLEAIGHKESLVEGKLDAFLPWRIAFANETRVDAARARDDKSSPQGRRVAAGLRAHRRGSFDVRSPRSEWCSDAPIRQDPPTSGAIHRGLPHGELEVIEGAGHMPWWDDPAAVGRSVRVPRRVGLGIGD